jgi:hypothetical protein
MNLGDFIKDFVCCNTIVRLWKPTKEGHEMVQDTCMEWELIKSDYSNCTVVGVTDILCEQYPEAVNIVIMGI